MSNKIMKCVLLLLMLGVADEAVAYDFASGGFYYNLRGNCNEVILTHGDEQTYSGEVHIPETVMFDGETYVVTEIGYCAFMNSTVTDVYVPNTVTAIGEGSFYNAENLENVTLPLYLNRIGRSAFVNTAISNIAIPEGVTRIAYGTFENCLNLNTVFLPKSLTKMEAEVFRYCTNLQQMYCASNSVIDADAWAAFDGLANVDVIVPGKALSKYEADEVWNNEKVFTIYSEEPVGEMVQPELLESNDECDKVALGNNLAYKVFVNGELVAITAAESYTLPRNAVNTTYTIVPTNYFADSEAMCCEVAGTSGIDGVDEDAVKIYASNGIVYICGYNHGKSVKVYDAYGRLCRAQTSPMGQIQDLPRGNVYIVVCGNTVQKVWL